MPSDDEVMRLAHVAASKCWSYDPAIDKDDLVQHAALAIIRSGLDGGFAVMKARSAIYDLKDSKQYRRRAQQQSIGDYQVAADQCDVTELALQNEDENRVRNSRCLTKQQKMIVCDLLDGWTQADIAERRGITLPGVSNQVSAAIKRLRKAFGMPPPETLRMGQTGRRKPMKYKWKNRGSNP